MATPGTNAAHVVSVNEDGSVTLWDAKYRSSATNPGISTTFTPGSNALNNALDQANDAIINASNLSDAARNAALDNLSNGNFTTITAAQGQASQSNLLQFLNFVAQR